MIDGQIQWFHVFYESHKIYIKLHHKKIDKTKLRQSSPNMVDKRNTS